MKLLKRIDEADGSPFFLAVLHMNCMVCQLTFLCNLVHNLPTRSPSIWLVTILILPS